MADERRDENLADRAQQKSFNAAPPKINMVTMIMIGVFVVIVTIGVILIGSFFMSDANQPGNQANSMDYRP